MRKIVTFCDACLDRILSIDHAYACVLPEAARVGVGQLICAKCYQACGPCKGLYALTMDYLPDEVVSPAGAPS